MSCDEGPGFFDRDVGAPRERSMRHLVDFPPKALLKIYLAPFNQSVPS